MNANHVSYSGTQFSWPIHYFRGPKGQSASSPAGWIARGVRQKCGAVLRLVLPDFSNCAARTRPTAPTHTPREQEACKLCKLVFAAEPWPTRSVRRQPSVQAT